MSAPEKVERASYSSDSSTEDTPSCCCWGRTIKVKKDTRPPLQRSYKQSTPPDELFGVKDANEVFKLGLDQPTKHVRQATKYPRDGVDADSTQSSDREKK